MYEPKQQNFLDLPENSGFGSDPKSWLSGDDLSRTLSSLSAAAAAASSTGNVDRVLFNDLVEMVPLVQSLIDRKANSSFTRRGSMIYTKTPSRESLYKRTAGRSATIANKMHGDSIQDGCADNFTNLSTKNMLSEKEKEELMTLRDQMEDLKKQLSEKEEHLKSLESSKKEMAAIQMKLDEVRNEAAEKDSMIKSSQLQLSDVKIKLADERAAVEKLQWESTTSKEKVKKLQEDLHRVEGEISSFMLLLQGLTNKDFPISGGDYDYDPYPFDQNYELNNEIDTQKLEAAREAYIAAVAAAKEKQDEVSIYAAAKARVHLQSIVGKQT
ncbi:movement protein binding protein 2C [Striga hermonthica]|uniref:Movement protein binding protein 2C n=1 Tax=Striga hermonthica TaxID=68872 RepID=A0A9N7RJL2_STRHE|nr:movement protein binding protein 2C [Striga hermonthica]